MNKILKFIYHNTNSYQIKGIHYKDLQFTEYKLYQVGYFFKCIPILILRDKTNSMINNQKKYTGWYYTHTDIKSNIKEK